MRKDYKYATLILGFAAMGLFFVVLWAVHMWIEQKREECSLYGISTEVCKSIITKDSND